MPKVATPSAAKKPNASAEKTPSNGSAKSGSGAGRKSKKSNPTIQREVLYEKVSIKLCAGEKAITVADAKKLLHWTEESENVKFGGDFLLVDENGNKIRCHNNVTNRFIYKSVYETLKQEILRRRWKLNGEPIIIGKTGQILNGQHTLVALVLAGQVWAKHQGQYSEWWPTEPTMDKLIVFGVDESDDTVNTMDTCKPRSLMDVIGRSEYFADVKKGERMKMARICDYAVRMLWHRTGAGMDAFAPRRTHAESLDFINRHPKILECVKHVYEEDGAESNLTNLLSLGYSAALLYLMGSCTTEREKETNDGYAQTNHPHEDQLDWSMWDTARDFWVLLAAGDKSLSAVKPAIVELRHAERATVSARMGTLVKAWNLHTEGKPINAESLALEFVENEDGVMKLAECPIVGGIDLGDPEKE